MSLSDYFGETLGQLPKAALDAFRTVMVLKSRHYKGLFFGENGSLRRDGEIVLADLRKFCHADKATIFSPDLAEMARREGRREVFVRLVHMLNLDEEAVAQLMEMNNGD